MTQSSPFYPHTVHETEISSACVRMRPGSAAIRFGRVKVCCTDLEVPGRGKGRLRR